MTARRAIPYLQAIDWIAENDDTNWLDDEEPTPSVTAHLVADIYGRSDEEVTADLKRAVEALEKSRKTR